MKKILSVVLLMSLFLVSCSGDTLPRDDPDKITIYYFWEPGCPSCDLQTDFLNTLSDKYSDVEVKMFDASLAENKDLLNKLSEAYEERVISSPATFIAEESIFGFGSAETTGLLIEDIIKRCQVQDCMNPSDVLRSN